VHVEGKTFRDGKGRQLLFRGYNAKVITLFDVTFDDGRVAEETFPDLSEAEAARIEQLGWNVLRIPVSWSGLEPHPLQYSAAFLAKLDSVIAMAKAHGFYIFVDMHQDGYSKEIGEDGEPLWAIEPPPTILLQGPYSDARRTEPPALNAGWSFFLNTPAADGRPLQNAYVEAVQQIVRHVVGQPQVLGYEAFNEPVPHLTSQLDAFEVTFAQAVHAIDADAPVLTGAALSYRRLVMALDTGGAIKGPVRADVFWGWAPEAEARAGKMRQPGTEYVLLPRAVRSAAN